MVTEDMYNEIIRLREENEKLQSELRSYKNGKNFYKPYKEAYGIAFNFCYDEYLDYYLSENFEDKFNEVTSILSDDNRHIFKYIFLRALFVNLLKKDTLFLDSEINDQINISNNNATSEFKFTVPVGFHSLDFGLTEDDLEFIKNKDIIDAGAYIGDTSLPFSKLTNQNVWAFEPFDETFNQLSEHVRINNVSNVKPIKKSLGNTNGEKSLFITGQDFSGITSKPEYRKFVNWEEFKVQECTLDNFVEENNLNVGYINVDVEGGELDLLNGAINVIRTQKPILAISIYHQAKDFFEIIPWINNLDLGYEFQITKELPWCFMQETMVIARVNK